MKFEWNEKKAKINIDKHGVSFEEAATVFYDEIIRIISARKATKKESNQYNRG